MRILVRGFVIVGLCMAAVSSEATLCTDYHQSVSDRFAQSDVVFLGKVKAVENIKGTEPPYYFGKIVYRMEVIERFKGNVRGQVKVTSPDTSAMMIELDVGDEFLVFSKYQNGEISSWYCDEVYFYDKNIKDILNELKSIKKSKSFWPW